MNHLKLICIFVIITVIQGNDLTTASQKLILPYQAHSFNDLGYFRQLLIKGVRVFKMDLTLATKECCEELSTWDGKNECDFNDSDFAMKTCCLGFRGDVSPMPILRQPFNTTQDFVDMISDPNNSFLLSKDTQFEQYQETIFLAVNIQNGLASKQIFEDFFYDLFQAINNNNLNIQMSYGTSFIQYFQEKCLNLNDDCTDKQKYIANQTILIQSSYTGEGYPSAGNIIDPNNPDISPIQQFNTAFPPIQSICLDGIPEWPTEYNWPLIFWEPSFEYSAQFVLQSFNNPECVKPKGYDSNKNPLAMACNQQPEMMDSFLQLKNITLYPEYPAKIVYDETKSPVLGYSEVNDEFYLGLTVNGQNEQQYVIRTIQQSQVIEQTIFEEEILKIKTSQNFILIQTTSSVRIFKNNFENQVYTQQKLPDYIDSNIIVDEQGNVYLINLTKFHGIQLQFVIQRIEEDSTFSYCETVLQGQYDQTTEKTLEFITSYNQKDDTLEFLIVFSRDNVNDYSFDKASEIFGASYVFNSPFTGNCEASKQQDPAHFSFGVEPRGVAYYIDGISYFALTYDYSSCYGGAAQNNNDWNKCEFQKHEELHRLLNIEYLLSYQFGAFSSFQKKLENEEIINACDSEIVMAKFYNGIRPTIALRKQDQKLKAWVAHGYVSYADLGFASTILCGTQYYDQDLSTNNASLMYSFQVPDFNIIKQISNTKNQQEIQRSIETY